MIDPDQTEELVVFRDRWLRGKDHILIIPRHHIVSTVEELRPHHLPLRQSSILRLKLVLMDTGVKMGYHIPPFSSVHHLHLHVITPPFTLMGRMQYPIRRGVDGGKGWTWFVSSDQVETILQREGSIRLAAS
ncbi:hypothetical protein TREMEDRAFT_24796 [Tremella mesenterica DSM 1558]|uniref:uncharacterized protein n=1 Tax=Tremella mesenterica (strain ATCC 24925 / CBS 8224 / DSM 1558 / NBRC 9311 / NRRL Y-6157 / RJB 2259-6 / UBC 559-6) TaxID=578456 RepID=UPI0003F4A643|nr:uncharacterized protein TREMEDRAFT_24796 [Tremella mesenterica DSM 1558]EIW72846.1 hypothetical protein TREMEDRAFT_24796 [Tremella mesenterica DSM 1558]